VLPGLITRTACDYPVAFRIGASSRVSCRKTRIFPRTI